MKYSLLLFLFFLRFLCIGQELQRVSVEGRINVPPGFDAEGIHIFNKNAHLGTISVGEGRFKLKMAKGDTLYFSAVQFESLKVVVDEVSLQTGVLNVEVREGLNELPEILIRPHNLSGNLIKDAENIETEDVLIPPRAAPVPGPPTGATSVENSAIKELGGGANHLELLVKAVKLIFPKRKKKVKKKKKLTSSEKASLRMDIREIFEETFFTNDLGISSREISDFLRYCIGDDFDGELLGRHKRLDLIQYLISQSREYATGN